MDASRFIARRLRFGGRISVVSIAISFLVMIVAVSISSGFREEIRDGISDLTGDVQLMPRDMNYVSEDSPISSNPSFLGAIDSLEGVRSISPAIYRAGVIKKDDMIHGVLFKGVPRENADSVTLGVLVPERLSEMFGIKPGDKLLSYFVGERVKVRNFNVTGTYEGVMDGTDNMVVLADISDMRRLNGWDEGQVSDIEISLDPDKRGMEGMRSMTSLIGNMAFNMATEEDDDMVATSVVSRYPQIFEWLDVIDFNVLFILILMTIVAGFNMVSGLLIMLFRNISTIGTLKAMGMKDKVIAKVFLRVASGIALKGMLAGNVLALVLCALQGSTHLLRLNPENYFVSFVPVSLDLPLILVADAVSYLVIILFLLIPCLFVSKVDPAQTVRAK